MTTSNILKLATFGDIAGLRQSNNGHQWDKDSAEDKVGIDNSDGKTYNQMLDSVIENDNVVVFIWLTENNFFYGEYLDYGTRRDFEQEILERCNPVKSTKLIGWLKKRLERGNVQTNCFYTRGDEKDDWTLMFSRFVYTNPIYRLNKHGETLLMGKNRLVVIREMERVASMLMPITETCCLLRLHLERAGM